MPRVTFEQEEAITNIEKMFFNDAVISCNKLASKIYNYHLARNEKKKFLLQKILEDSIISGKYLFDKLNQHQYHPIFIADTNGKFIWFNNAANTIFTEFSLNKGGNLQDLYAAGAIYFKGDTKNQISYNTICKLALRKSRKYQTGKNADLKLTDGNDFVFFTSKPEMKLAQPLAGTLQVSTLHHKSCEQHSIGTIGIMSVPTVLFSRSGRGEKQSVFIAIPFSVDWINDVYRKIKISILASGSLPIRVDHVKKKDDILKDILRRIQECKMIIADVSDNNENVLFELGYALALSKPYIIISHNSRNKSAFDIKHLDMHKYSLKKLPQLQKDLFEMIIKGGSVLTAPILEQKGQVDEH